MAKPDALFDRKLAAIFQAEAAEHVQRMQASLAGADGELAGKPLELLYRAAHSLKGAARATNALEIESICQSLIDLALARGGEDNVTVIMGKARGP